MSIDKWIETKEELRELAKTLGVRYDWHEPDEQDVDVRLVACIAGKSLSFDNAHGDESEHQILLTHHDARIDPVVTYALNVANLLAWACK